MKAYTCLLYFYTGIMEFFMEERLINRVFESFRSEIPGIVSTFEDVVAKIQSLAQAEAVAIIMDAKQQEVRKFGMLRASRPLFLQFEISNTAHSGRNIQRMPGTHL